MNGAGRLSRSRTVDPLPRTVLAWQRTLLTLTAATLALAFALIRSGLPGWAVAMLLLGTIPVPLVLRRERDLLYEPPTLLRRRSAALLTGASAGLAIAGLVLVLVL